MSDTLARLKSRKRWSARHQAARRPAADHWRRELSRRRQVAGDGLCGHPAVAARARQDSEYRHQPAKSMPGVVGVFTGDDFMDLNPLPAAWQAAGSRTTSTRRGCSRSMRFIRSATRWRSWSPKSYSRRSMRSKPIAVEYEELPAVVDAKKATEPARRSSTRTRRTTSSSNGPAARRPPRSMPRWLSAEVRIEQHIINQRLIPTPMEPRGSIGALRSRHRSSTPSGRRRRRRTSTGCCWRHSCWACRSRRSG